MFITKITPVADPDSWEDEPLSARDAIATAVKVGDAYATADRAIRLLAEAGFRIIDIKEGVEL